MILAGALGVMLGALPTQALHSQMISGVNSRPALEGFYTQIRFDANGTALHADGIGAKLMWSPSAFDTTESSFFGRTSLGLYGMYTPAQSFTPGLRFSSVGVGAVAELRPFVSPLASRIDPFVSVGAGVLHTSVDRTVSPAPSPLLDRSRSVFTVAPGVGARVMLTPSAAVQGEVRDLMTFRGDTRHNVAFGAGLRLSL
jgi:hypothetical protein